MICAARRYNETYPWEKYMLEIDTWRFILSNQAINIREASMWHRSIPLLGILDHRNGLDALNDEFERDHVDF